MNVTSISRSHRGTALLLGIALACCYAVLTGVSPAHAQDIRVVDIPTRPGVTQRFVVSAPSQPKAAAILFAGGHGGLQIDQAGKMAWGSGNFLVRSQKLFVAQGLVTAIIDAPSDRQSPPYLGGHRQTQAHAADVKAVIAWLREHTKLPVWLVGTSRGTQSAAYVATALSGPDAPDGIVLTASILNDARSRSVPDMPLETLKIPVLVAHHEQDGCRYCLFSDIPRLMDKLAPLPRKQLLTFTGGRNVGDPCEALSYHGFNGLEAEVVARIAEWMLAK